MAVAPKWLKIFKATCLGSIYDILIAPKVAATVEGLLFSISFVCFAIRQLSYLSICWIVNVLGIF
jgi:hypothetical protein